MKNNSKPNYEKPETIIGNDTVIEGTLLKAKNSLQINGTYIGNLEVEGSIVIGETGKVEGNTKSEFLLVAGAIKGNIEVSQQVHIMPTGKVVGDIQCSSIIIDDGAYLDGTCKMNSSPGFSKSDAKDK
ncbi:MAG: polymer-forming cytoskeletal protein [Eubacteriales bacterium]